MTGSRNFPAHRLVQLGNHYIPRIVCDILRTSGHGYGCALRRTDSQDIDFYSLFRCRFGHLHSSSLIVLSIGNHKNSLAHVLIGRKTFHGQINSLLDIRSLRGNHGWIYRFQKHLGRHVITCYRQLGIGLSGIHDQSDLIIRHFIHNIAYQHFGFFQTARRYIFSHHRIGYVHGYNGLYSLTLTGIHFCPELRTGQSEYQQCQSRKHQPRLHLTPGCRNIRHQAFQEFDVAITKQTLPAVIVCGIVQTCQ